MIKHSVLSRCGRSLILNWRPQTNVKFTNAPFYLFFLSLLVPSEREKLFCILFNPNSNSLANKTCSFNGKQSVIRSDDEERIVSNYLNRHVTSLCQTPSELILPISVQSRFSFRKLISGKYTVPFQLRLRELIQFTLHDWCLIINKSILGKKK